MGVAEWTSVASRLEDEAAAQLPRRKCDLQSEAKALTDFLRSRAKAADVVYAMHEYSEGSLQRAGGVVAFIRQSLDSIAKRR